MHRPKVLRKLAMLGGGAALGAAFLAGGAAPASAQTFTTQHARVVNSGFAYASTRGNVAIGNGSTSTPSTGTSTGTAIVHTGNAFAAGNISFTWINGLRFP
jgi:hypothetical protein